MNLKNIPPKVALRILDFFNQVEQVSDIVGPLIQDDPADGPGRTIGPVLAARILRARTKQASGQFENLEQLDAIPGFGEGTWKDLVYTFGRSAAVAFRDSLYLNNLIYRENWPVWVFEFPIESEDRFQELAYHETAYREFISEKLLEIAQKEKVDESLAQSTADLVKQALTERFQDETLAALTFSIWFYRLDPGNWFSFDRMYEQALDYFQFHASEEIYLPLELVAFKGVPGTFINPGIVAPDLITILNYPEQSITIWMGTLYD